MANGIRSEKTGLAIGSILHGRSFRCTLARTLAFSGGPLDTPGWPQRNLHTDEAKALEAGLPGIIVSGTQFEGLLLSYLTDLFGEHWYRNGKLEAKFVRNVFINDVVLPVVIVRDIETVGQEIVFHLDVWCERQDGEKALIGQACVNVPASESASGSIEG